ncbi:MAG: segregation/condensation protein A [Eubacteriales bacterium]|nr:segregation/condensation protein A [Clostridium sp.]MDD7503886.1 segregation/condensation protein A [Clostridium sp.]MDY5001668.1 segregation/condensation protein A [Eubacteriales bacterium]MDY5755401.1 segregation/condensation protein A [Eubacteriales bacterium]MDY6089240.1 segregation/condensation protein A [Eubacteriales bacterium]
MEYRVHLSQFSGPLDLLLHLVEKAEVDIKDIFVSEITSEFLEYLKEIDELDMEQASSFLTVAATLVYMKSRSLFPPAPKEEEEEEDPGELLIRQLREYKTFKEASETMRELAHEAARMHSKLPEEFPVPPAEIILKDTTTQKLFEAMLSALNRGEEPEKRETLHEVTADAFTIRSCSRRVRDVLRSNNGKTCFEELTEGASKMEIIVTFMALLEMISCGEIRLSQERYCGRIDIYALKLIRDDEKISYMDEEK